MPDNGDNIIDGNDIYFDYNLNLWRFDLTSNRGDMVLADGMGLVFLYGGGYTVNSLDLNDTNYGVRVWDWNITGSGAYGVVGSNLDNAIFYEVDVSNSQVQALNLEGDGITIAYSDIANIGSDSYQGIVAGMALQGSSYDVYGGSVSGLHSAFEAYAVGFNSSGGTDNSLSSINLNGSGSTRWTFGVWSSNPDGEVTLDSVTASNWVWGIGGATADVYDSTFSNAKSGTANFVSGNTVTEGDHDDAQYGSAPAVIPVTNAGNNVYIGDNTDQVFFPGTGADVMEGLGGNDTFHFIAADAIDVVIGFGLGDDTIVIDFAGYNPGDIVFQAHGTYTTTAAGQATIVQNQYTDTFIFDPDGAGGSAGSAFLYTPGSTLTLSDFLFL
jgi:hypothetical protein